MYDQKLPSNLKKLKGGSHQDWVRTPRAAGWYEQAGNPKHRYVQMLDRKDKALVERIEAMRQPYSQRE